MHYLQKHYGPTDGHTLLERWVDPSKNVLSEGSIVYEYIENEDDFEQNRIE